MHLRDLNQKRNKIFLEAREKVKSMKFSSSSSDQEEYDRIIKELGIVRENIKVAENNIAEDRVDSAQFNAFLGKSDDLASQLDNLGKERQKLVGNQILFNNGKTPFEIKLLEDTQKFYAQGGTVKKSLKNIVENRNFDATEGVVPAEDSRGGHLLPPPVVLGMLIKSSLLSPVSNLVTSIALTNGRAYQPIDSTENQTALYEGDRSIDLDTYHDATIGNVLLDGHDVSWRTAVTLKMLRRDEGALLSYLTGISSKAFAIAKENAILLGSGTGEPSGILNSNGVLGAENNVVTNDPLTISKEDMDKLRVAMKVGYRSQAVFVMSKEVYNLILPKTSVNDFIAFQTIIANSLPTTYLGVPVIETELFPNDLSAGSIGVLYSVLPHYVFGIETAMNLQVFNQTKDTRDRKTVQFVYSASNDGTPSNEESSKRLVMKA